MSMEPVSRGKSHEPPRQGPPGSGANVAATPPAYQVAGFRAVQPLQPTSLDNLNLTTASADILILDSGGRMDSPVRANDGSLRPQLYTRGETASRESVGSRDRDEGYKSDKSGSSSESAHSKRRVPRKGPANRSNKGVASHGAMASAGGGGWRGPGSLENRDVLKSSAAALFGRSADPGSSDDEEKFVYKGGSQTKRPLSSRSHGPPASVPQRSGGQTTASSGGKVVQSPYAGNESGSVRGMGNMVLPSGEPLDHSYRSDSDAEGYYELEDGQHVPRKHGKGRRCWRSCKRSLVYWCMCWACFTVAFALVLLSYTLFMLPLQTGDVRAKNVLLPTELECKTSKECLLTYTLELSVTNRNLQSVDLSSVSVTTYIALDDPDRTSNLYRWDQNVGVTPDSVPGQSSKVVAVRLTVNIKDKISAGKLRTSKFLLRSVEVLHYKTFIIRDHELEENKKLFVNGRPAN